ncbi:MAG: DUF922 domain-containing protein [Taibaiella sp.]|nr:DUF922 domain-containing protein [Taibaiella sp.]
MAGAFRVKFYAFIIGVFALGEAGYVHAKSGKEGTTPNAERPAVSQMAEPKAAFQWSETRQLSWNDFKGAVAPASQHSAAASHCGMSITAQPGKENKPEIIVTNSFYSSKSWVQPDGRFPEVLVHEQGHFDLCEIYTRKLREKLSSVSEYNADLKNIIETLYSQVDDEYQKSQRAYEEDTQHGTDAGEQKKWLALISRELTVNTTGAMARQ